MAVEYDLVIVGSSWAGMYAAKNAVQLQARVALVTQCDERYLPNDTLFNQSLGEIGRFNDRRGNSFVSTATIPDFALAEANNWIENTNLAIQSLNSLANLAVLGVDVIVGKGEFYRLPQLGLQVEGRKLRSRNFLLATGSNFVPPFFPLKASEDYLTLRDLENGKLSDLPTDIIVVGGDPTALELAQTLARLGKKITLVVQQSRILPQEDLDISTFILAQLEAEGIEIYTNSVVSQIKIINQQKWLQAGDRALVAAEIIIVDYRQPNIAGLNLAGVDVKYNEQRVYVNSKLQTTNPRIYACGDSIGGYCLPNITRYEVNLILKNTLFFAWYKTNYDCLPWAIFTQPNLARVGWSEHQAKQQYPEKILVIEQDFSTVERAQVLNSTTGKCKLLVKESGEILGCSLIGDRAAELIAIPALMMQQKIKLDPNPMRGLTSISLPTIYPSMSEIFTQAANDFYQQKIQDNPSLIERLRTWLSWRKSR